MRIVGAIVAAAVATLAIPAGAQPIELNFAHVLSEKSAYQVIFTRFSELMKERSQGRVSVRIQCCGQGGTEPRLIQSARTGVIDGMFVGGSSLESVVKDYRVLSLPYAFDDHAQRLLPQRRNDDKIHLRIKIALSYPPKKYDALRTPLAAQRLFVIRCACTRNPELRVR